MYIKYILMQNIYKGSSVKSMFKVTEDFNVGVGVDFKPLLVPCSNG